MPVLKRRAFDHVDGVPAVAYAAMTGNIRRLQYLVLNQPIIDLEEREPEQPMPWNHDGTKYLRGDTPFIAAARNGHVNAVELLMNLGVDPNAQSRYIVNLKLSCNIGQDFEGIGQTALHAAAIAGHWDVVRCLLERGINTQTRGMFYDLNCDVDHILQIPVFGGFSVLSLKRDAPRFGTALKFAILSRQLDVFRMFLQYTRTHGRFLQVKSDYIGAYYCAGGRYSSLADRDMQKKMLRVAQKCRKAPLGAPRSASYFGNYLLNPSLCTVSA